MICLFNLDSDFGMHFGDFKVSSLYFLSLHARGAIAAPKGDRQVQIEGMLFLETAETANQQTVPK